MPYQNPCVGFMSFWLARDLDRGFGGLADASYALPTVENVVLLQTTRMRVQKTVGSPALLQYRPDVVARLHAERT